MGGLQFGWGNESKQNSSASQFDLRRRWEVVSTILAFQRIFGVGLLGYVGRVVTVFSPPQSTGLLFEFGPGMHDDFERLVDAKAFPPRTLDSALQAKPSASKPVTPDNPGVADRDAWWRQAASGAAIGASFREEGTQTSLHIAFNDTLCDVHVDRNGFVVTEGGYTHWNLNNLLRHMTYDLVGDKLPWVLGSVSYLDKRNRPIFQATVGPWLAVDLPEQGVADRTTVKVGLAVVGYF